MTDETPSEADVVESTNESDVVDDDVALEDIELVETPLVERTGDSRFDALLEGYERTLRTVGNLPELAMRRAKLDEVLKKLDVEERVWWIDQLIRGALWGRSPEIDAMLACSSWLVQLNLDHDYDFVQGMFAAAHDAKRESILFLLRNVPPHRALKKGARLPEVNLPTGRDVTLGEKRWIASGSDRKFLERLLRDNNPLVIQKLAANPALRLQDMLTIVTRRPTNHALVIEVLNTDSWFVEHQIREAVVYNPYVRTGVALKLLPTLHVDVLRKLRFAGDLHPMIAEAAKMLVELREQRTAPWGY